MTTVELKRQRTALKAERKTLAEAVRERDMSDDEAISFEDLTKKIDALSKRIDALEMVEQEDDDDPVDGEPEATEGEAEDDEGMDRSKRKRRSTDHFANISTTKTRKDADKYSLRRALALHSQHRRIDGIEGEHSQEIAFQRGTSPAGFFMPWDFKCRGRHKLNPTRRDFTTTTGTGAVGITVEAEFIELLRNRMVTDELGVTIKHNLKGKYAIPRQNAASTMYFIGEGSSATGSNPTFDQVNFVPKTAAVQVNVSRKSLFEMSIDAEAAVEEDMLKVLAIGLDTNVLAGNGTGANPTGILYDSNVSVQALSADTGNGADATFMDILNFESTLTQANADRGSIAWVTTPAVRSKWKQTPKINSGQVYPEFLWAPDNTVNGYKALVTNEMPNGLTKGSGANLNSVIFGNWEDAVLALWGGIDIVINPYINVSAGAIQFNLFQEIDTQRMHSNSFVVSTAVANI